jgi:hypothetical protein
VPTVPAIGLVLVLSVDWFIGIARALGNLIGNCVATVVIGAWEHEVDVLTAKRVLDGDMQIDVTAGLMLTAARSLTQDFAQNQFLRFARGIARSSRPGGA